MSKTTPEDRMDRSMSADDWREAYEGASANGSRLGTENARLRADLDAARADLRREIAAYKQMRRDYDRERARADAYHADTLRLEAERDDARARLDEIKVAVRKLPCLRELADNCGCWPCVIHAILDRPAPTENL